MNIRITPNDLVGTVTPPPSKSLSHRALIAAYLSGGRDRIRNLADSRDIDATKRCMDALMTVSDGLPVLDCGESGSTLRFLMPLSLVLRGGAKFIGHGRLMDRPQEPYFDIFSSTGVRWERSGRELTLRGELRPKTYCLPGDVSSQFVTGLLLALPLLEGDSTVVITSPLQSRDYAAMTVEVLKKYGIHVENRNFRLFYIPGGQRYTPCDYEVEADWSQAAFWYAAAFLGNRVTVEGMSAESTQGDRVIYNYYRSFPGKIDLSQIPDLLPPLAVMAAVKDREIRFLNAGRLRMKESDRIETVAELLRAFGILCATGPDFLSVRGGDNILPCDVDGAGDHRIVMAAAILASKAAGPVTIRGAEAVEKSYPTFFEEYKRLGGMIRVL